MAYFMCTAVGGGVGNTVVITCDADFAGVAVTLSDGTTTKTNNCPTSSPYQMEFYGIEEGTWTVSATVEGSTYSETFVVQYNNIFLSTSYNWKTWVSRGGLDPDDYEDLDDVFDDEQAVRRLMLVHNSADYLVAAVIGDIDFIDDFCANDTAMKWIGLSDYLCDKLIAIPNVESKFLASTYYTRYLKDHIPYATGQYSRIPYGDVEGCVMPSGYYLYSIFDGVSDSWYTNATTVYVTYKFPAPTMCKKFELYVTRNGNPTGRTLTIYGSNDNSTFTSIGTISIAQGSSAGMRYADLTNSTYYLYYKIQLSGRMYDSTGVVWRFGKAQFYGRSLYGVSVPQMTSNVAPYGEAISTSVYSENDAYKCFDHTTSTYGAILESDTNGYIGYHFTRKFLPRMVDINPLFGGSGRTAVAQIIGSNNGTTWTVLKDDVSLTHGSITTVDDITTDEMYSYIAVRMKSLGGSYGYFGIEELQFYGKDYSEKEFSLTDPRMTIYDHGVDLVTLDTTGSVVVGAEAITLTDADAQASKNINLTNYTYLNGKVGDYLDYDATTDGNTRLIASSIATAYTPVNNAEHKMVLDVSAIDQVAETGVKMIATSKTDFAELWLE